MSSLDERHVLAVDVGGTNMKVAQVTKGGRVLEARAVATPDPDDAPTPLALLRTLICEEASVGNVQGVGVAVPGNVDEERGVVLGACNLAWHDLDVRRLLQAETDCPVVVGHDVRAGALAEARAGRGQPFSSFVFVPVGTGIAAAIVVGGRPVRGAHSAAGEIGHVVIEPSGEPCACGRSGCVEALGSAAAISRRYRSATGAGLPAPLVIERAAAGEEAAKAVWEQAIAAIARGIVMVQAVVDPEAVIVGGGLSLAGAALFDPLRAACKVWGAPPGLAILPAALGDTAAWRGAAMLAWDRLD